MTKQTFNITGMTCGGCVRTVTTILQNQAGVNKVEVTLEPGQAEVEYDESQTSPEKLAKTIGQMGYTMQV